ncbi:MAG TPA: fibronectin type III domain-containing protein [Lacunisphaera sp.]|nr:fibronectin type III domain-containing protein [Lacunisphaera sp.]
MMSRPRSSSRSSLVLAGACVALTNYCPAQQVLVFDSGQDDRGQAIATDAAGSMIVGGRSGNALADAFAVLKYNAAGTLQWLARVQGLPDSYTGYSASDVLTDAAGNIYAVGTATKALPFFQYEYGWLVASFTPTGTQRWAQLANGAGNSMDRAFCAALHPTQGLYVTGITSDAFGRGDWLTIKYSTAGVELWRRVEPGLGNTEDQPVAIKADAAGNAVVVGFRESSQGGPRDLRVIKYDPAGNVLWRADYAATATSDDFPNDLAIDAAGNIYVVADVGTLSAEDPTTCTTLKFDANGNLLYVLAGPGKGGSAIALDGAGNFVVSGTSVGPVGSNVVEQTSKFTPDGTMLWNHPVSSPNLAVDDVDGSVYLTRGSSYSVLKLNSAGALQWERAVPPGWQATDLVVDAATGALVVTGNTTSTGGNIVTARFVAGSTPPPPPPPPVPAAPSNLTASAKKGSIALGWTDNANNETGFRLERATGSGAFVEIAQVAANVRNYTSSGLTKGVSYTFRVRAFNANGNSAYSNPATGIPR